MSKLDSTQPNKPRGFRSELINKIKTNPWKTLGTFLLATAFPIGTAIAGAIATGVVAKSAVDTRKNKASSKATAPTQGKRSAPRGFGSELTNKIKTNPWKTLGTVLLATGVPVGTVIAGVITAGVVAKSARDASVNKKAAIPIAKPIPNTNPTPRSQTLYAQKITPTRTPTQAKGQGAGRG